VQTYGTRAPANRENFETWHYFRLVGDFLGWFQCMWLIECPYARTTVRIWTLLVYWKPNEKQKTWTTSFSLKFSKPLGLNCWIDPISRGAGMPWTFRSAFQIRWRSYVTSGRYQRKFEFCLTVTHFVALSRLCARLRAFKIGLNGRMG